MRNQVGRDGRLTERTSWRNLVFTFSPGGFLSNLAHNFIGISLFFFRIYVSSTPISPGKYVLWRNGLAAQGVDLPLSLSRTTLSGAKRLVFMNRPVTVSISKRSAAEQPQPLSAATYQSPRKVLRFYSGAGLVIQSIRPRPSSQYAIFETFVRTVPSAALLEESNSRSIRLKLLQGPNLAQLESKARHGAVISILKSLSELPLADADGVKSAEALMRLPRGPLRGRGTKLLSSFFRDPDAIEVLSNSKLVPAHTDLNLFNIILDDEGQPRTIDFDFRRIQLLPRWFDALVLTRQCAADFFMTGQLDSELAPFFGDAFGSLDYSKNFIGRQREAIFDFASVLLAPKLGSVRSLFPNSWCEAERRIVYSRKRFLGQNYF